MSPPEILRLSFPDLGALEREIANNLRYGRIFIAEILDAPVLSEGVLVIVHPVDGRELRLQAQIVMINNEGPMRGTGLALRGFGPSEVEQIETFARDRKPAAAPVAPRPIAPAAPANDGHARVAAPPSAADDDWSDLAAPAPPARPRPATAPVRPRVATQPRFPVVTREENVSDEPRVVATYPRAATAARPPSTASMARAVPREDGWSDVVPTPAMDARETAVPPPRVEPPTIDATPAEDDWSDVASLPTPAPPAPPSAVSHGERDDDDWSGVAPGETAPPPAAALEVSSESAPTEEIDGAASTASDDSAATPSTLPRAASEVPRDDDDWSGVAPDEPDAADAAPQAASEPPRDDDDWSGVAPDETPLEHEEAEPDEAAADDGEPPAENEPADAPHTRARDLQSGNRQEQLRSLNIVEQLKIARRGELSDRVVIERLYGKTVWEALLQNPRITLPEVARIARKGTVPRPLLEIMLENASWLKASNIRRALLSNPKLPPEGIQKLLRLTPKHELKVLEKATAYPMAVRDAARKLLRE